MLPVARLAAMTAAASVKVTPDVLVWAREHSAASLDEAVARTKHELAEVLDWEAGKADPPLTALRELANLYGVPLTVFMLDARPKVQPRPVDMRAFTGVTKPEPSLELAKALNRAAALQTLAHDLMEELGIPTTVTGPADQGDAEQLAATQRALVGVSLETQRKWKDERHALREWRAAIERRGVFVIQRLTLVDPKSTTLSGLYPSPPGSAVEKTLSKKPRTRVASGQTSKALKRKSR